MRCERCGKIVDKSYTNYNGRFFCPECAKELGLPDAATLASSAFRFLDDGLTSFFPLMREQLEFSPTRSQIKCPKCGTTLKEFEATGNLGCIECYNTFNESVMRLLMRLQADNHYRGRSPGIASEPMEDSKETKEIDAAEIGSNSESKEPEVSPAKEIAADENKLLKYSNADIGMLTNEDLNEAIKLAVAHEDYLLAAKFRDELRSREGV